MRSHILGLQPAFLLAGFSALYKLVDIRIHSFLSMAQILDFYAFLDIILFMTCVLSVTGGENEHI